MKFQTAAAAAFLLAVAQNLGTVDGSHVVSGTTSRLPMGLSTVTNDLEAEGASYVTTAAFLSSKSVMKSTRAALLRSLFGVTGSGDHDDEVEDGTTTAFGKKLSEDDEESDTEEGGSGVAVACPAKGASASEVASTVVACDGNVVYVADAVDLRRGEGLFDTLGPAVERLLAARAEAEAAAKKEAEEGTSGASAAAAPVLHALVVVVHGAKTQQDLEDARKRFETAAASMLSGIVQPSVGTRRASVLGDIFDNIEYVFEFGPVDGVLREKGGTRGPADISDGIASVVAAGMVDGPLSEIPGMARAKLTTPLDLAAVRRLGPAAHAAMEACLSTVTDVVGGTDNAGGTTLVSNFGELCDAAVKRAMEQFDADAGPTLVKQSGVARQIRSDLLEGMYSELSDLYETQISELKLASFESFRRGLSKLRVSPNLSSDMDKVVSESTKEFESLSKKLRASKASWPSAAAAKSDVKRQMREYCTDRLQAARASGQYRPAPRKGVSLGFHWLLPKPFGNDYRQEPWQVHTQDDLVYAPEDGVTDVGPADIRTGDWRKSVVPSPAGTEMVYLK